ncbi:MAG TPA: carboxypeptidase regulatory-like domain-containing protein [Terriglobia bacterium]|nr:carboxypeptidase regulatory-like domain-containing protein [Terriglobia bacterium]
MFGLIRKSGQVLIFVFLQFFSPAAAFAQLDEVSLRGQVTDPSGAVVPAVTVTLIDPAGGKHETQTNEEGRYVFRGLSPGTYTVQVQLKGFANFEKPGVVVRRGQTQVVDVQLAVHLETQKVTVKGEGAEVSVSPTSTVGALVMRGDDLKTLSDNPDDLEQELMALAGPAAGPNGGQIYIDGFTEGRLPPKESIREVRVNQSPFAAEYDRLGFGRIEIFTKPGSEKFHGQGFFEYGNSIFNSRNPFAPTKPPYQSRQFGGNVGGPLSRKSSFFVDAERRNVDEVSVVNTVIVDPNDPNYNLVPYSAAILNPTWRTTVSPRLDYQLTPKNTLVARYSYLQRGADDNGIGQFSLPSQGYDTRNHEHVVQVTETAVLGARAVNETRFQYMRQRTKLTGDNFEPTVAVLGAFTSGGISVGPNITNHDHYEINNVTSLTMGKHLLKFGGRLRNLTWWDSSEQNYNGTFTFDSIDSYRTTLMGLANGLGAEAIRAQGGGASQFSIITGNPVARFNQYDVGLFVQDDWRVLPNFSLSAGLRYETQNQIGDHRDFAPRLGLAWGLGRGQTGQPRTVVRAGAGLFYDRFSPDLTLEALRLNGVTQRQYLVANPDFFPNIPPLGSLPPNTIPQTLRTIAPDLVAPYVVQSAVGIERQLPKNITLAVTYTNSHGLHILRSRNINAPLPGTYDPANPQSGIRPYGTRENIYQYESSGLFNQNQLIANFNARISPKFSLFGFYMLNRARGNTDGANTFPGNQYDMRAEYGRAMFDVRHRFFTGGLIALPLGFRISPFMIVSSGQPFNIFSGPDLNGDSIFNDRPAFATDTSRPSVVTTRYGNFDPLPLSGATIIPRNYAGGPGRFSLNMHLTKIFSFGKGEARAASSFPGGGGGPRGGGRGGPPGGGLGPRGLSGAGGPPPGMFHPVGDKRYTVEITLDVHNVFNNVNLAPPIGDLSSPLFGQSRALGGPFTSSTANRRVELETRFTF